jgi:hypothetical protein
MVFDDKRTSFFNESKNRMFAKLEKELSSRNTVKYKYYLCLYHGEHFHCLDKMSFLVDERCMYHFK